MPDPVHDSASESAARLTPDCRRLWWLALPGLLAMAAVLYLFPLSSLNLPGLALMVVVLSACLYQYFLPLHLIRRHALLEHVTSENSVLRRLLWNGLWSKLTLLLWSVLLSLAVLVLLNNFTDGQWLVLLFSIPLMLISLPIGLRLTGAESGARYHFPLALRVAVYLTVACTTLALVVLHLTDAGVEDTRHLGLMQLVSQSWADGTGSAAVREVGWLLGVHSVLDDGLWYLMQQASSLSEQSAVIKLSAWLVFLLFVTVQASVFWFVLAGLVSWVMKAQYAGDRLLSGANPVRTFASGICGFAVIAYLLTLPGVTGFANRLADRALQALPVPPADPCVRGAPQELSSLTSGSASFTHAATSDMQIQLMAQLEQSLDTAFAAAEPAVERYLDWNFSVTGQYQQMFFLASAVVRSGLDYNNPAGLQHGIEQRLSEFIGARIDRDIGATLAPALQQVTAQAQQQFAASASQIMLQHAQYVEDQLGASQCLQLRIPTAQLPELINRSAVGAGPVAALVATRIATRSSVRLGANVMSRNAAKRAVSASAARVAAKTVPSTGAGGLGLSCGPLAPVCVPALFATVWLSTDVVINGIDEAVNRDVMRADLLAALQTEKQRIITSYQDILGTGAAQLIANADAYRAFRILEQGI